MRETVTSTNNIKRILLNRCYQQEATKIYEALPTIEIKYLQLIFTDCLIDSKYEFILRASRQGAFFCVLGNANYFSLVMSLERQNGRRPCGRSQIPKLFKFGGVYICNKTRLVRRIKSRIPVVNKSIRLCCQAVMSVYVRQLRETRVG